VGKRKIKPSQLKRKGRRLQKKIAARVSIATGIEAGKDCLIQSREMGQSGCDVRIVGEALERYPFSIECKNQESWSVPKAIEQAKSNLIENTEWQLFLSKNHYDPVVVMDAGFWFEHWKKFLFYYDYYFNHEEQAV